MMRTVSLVFAFALCGATTLFAQQDTTAARQAYTQARSALRERKIDDTLNRANGHYRIGMIREKLGDTASARAEYARAPCLFTQPRRTPRRSSTAWIRCSRNSRAASGRAPPSS